MHENFILTTYIFNGPRVKIFEHLEHTGNVRHYEKTQNLQI